MNRRRILLTVLPVLGVGLLASRMGKAQAARLAETDPAAIALGYKDDASRVDTRKWANYKPGSICANCQLYQGKPSDPTAPCGAFGGKAVAAKGWCAAWVKRP